MNMMSVKVAIVIVAIVVGAAAYCFLLLPRSLECDVGLEGLTIRLERSPFWVNYRVRVDTAPGVEFAADLSRSSEISADRVPVLQAILAEVGIPSAHRIGSKEFRKTYCSGEE
jgi:hypothetical protein